MDILAILYTLRTYRVHGTDPQELQPGQTTNKSGKTYGRFDNEDLRDREFRSVTEDIHPDVEAQGGEDLIQKEGNPFRQYGGGEVDDDADPRGDAGLPSRYPP